MEQPRSRVQIIATTNPKEICTKQEFDTFGGMAAGVCYMNDTFDALRTEDHAKTARRVKMTKESGHHSVYDHCYISMFLQDIPRVIECMLDNERMMVSSVKSGRYTRHALSSEEGVLYDKWVDIFKGLIRDKYADSSPKFFTEGRIEKLAMENARYLTSSFTRISMIHTISYRQLNYVYGFMRDFVAKKSTNHFINKTKRYVEEFLKQLDATGFIDEGLIDSGKNRMLSLFKNGEVSEYFGNVYATSYKGSFAYFCHANRHRTLKYHVAEPPSTDKLEFYTPEILHGNKKLCSQWNKDLDSLREYYPQAFMLNITEMGNIDDFILKLYERKCSVVMLETMRYTNDLLNKYVKVHPELKDYVKGSRCTFKKFNCTSTCGFPEGIAEKRKI